MFRPPLAAHVPPPAPTQVQVTPPMAAGTVSDTVAPLTPLGPEFDATIVYVMGEPGTTVAWPSVFVIERSAWGVRMSVSVAELLAGLGSATLAGAVTVAVFDSVPVAAGSMVAVAVKVTVPPGSTATGRLMRVLSPTMEQQVEPGEAEQVQLTFGSAAGNVSATAAPFAVKGPALPTVIVYVTGWPGTAVLCPSVFVTERLACGPGLTIR